MQFSAVTQLPADFGPALPPEGIQGLLFVTEPEDACVVPATPPDLGGRAWVALIRRTQGRSATCTFDVKVTNAAKAGAAAAIVHDQDAGPLIIMSKPFGHPDPPIPSVFITQKSGILLKQLLQPGVSIVLVTSVRNGGVGWRGWAGGHLVILLREGV